MRRFDSNWSYTIRTFFEGLSRVPIIAPDVNRDDKTGEVRGRDEITYRCQQCEAETLRFGE